MDRGVVDSHQHFWTVGLFEYPWMSPDLGVLYRDYGPSDLEPLAAECDVTATVLVQASNSIAESRWMLGIAEAHPLVAGVVGWVDLASPDVDSQLDELSAHGKFKGVRHLVESEPDDGWLVRSSVVEGLRALAARDLTFDLLVHTRHLDHVPMLADACPTLRMVVDHAAKPPIASRAFDDWAAKLERIATIDTVHCKLSGLATEADHATWTDDDLRPYADHVFSCFGPDRVLFGSDYPVSLLAGSYERIVGSLVSLVPESLRGQRSSRQCVALLSTLTMSQTYFITGAQGCIGSWIVKLLVERGDDAVVFDLSADRRRLDAIMSAEDVGRVRFLTGDVTDGEGLRTAMESSGASKIIHLAGLQVPTCKADPVRGALVNVVGTLNVFQAALASGVRRVVYASSAAVLGLSEDDAPVDESAACEPSTHYGIYKRANEGNAKVFFADNGVSSVGLRPLTVYGVNRDFGLTSDPTKAVKAAILGRSFHIRFGGATDFIYAADAAAAFIDSADRAPLGAYVFNLHGETAAVDRFVRIVDEQLPGDQKGLITFGGPPVPVAPAMNDAAFRSAVGGTSATPLADGIRETIAMFSRLRDENRLDTSDIDAEGGRR